MIKIDKESLLISGELMDVLGETAMIIKSIHNQISRISKDERVANESIALIGRLAFAQDNEQKTEIMTKIEDSIFAEYSQESEVVALRNKAKNNVHENID